MNVNVRLKAGERCAGLAASDTGHSISTAPRQNSPGIAKLSVWPTWPRSISFSRSGVIVARG